MCLHRSTDKVYFYRLLLTVLENQRKDNMFRADLKQLRIFNRGVLTDVLSVLESITWMIMPACLLAYFCCSKFDCGVSMKRFVLLQFLNLRRSAGPHGRGISLTQVRYLHTNSINRRQTSIPWVKFEPTIPMFEWAKTRHASGYAATVIGDSMISE